jgi:DNA-binding response OmpR family regulator
VAPEQICELSRFVPVILLIPQASMRAAICGHNSSGTPDELLNVEQKFRAFEITGRPLLQDEVSFGQVMLNFREMSACRGELPVALTRMEFKVLKYLVNNAMRVISREELLNQVWGYENYPNTRTVDNHIYRLRQKLEDHPDKPVHIQTAQGFGYKFLP